MQETIARLAARPEPFARGDVDLWTDPRVAPRMLAAHLDPETDAASRRPERIDAEVAWIASGAPAGVAVLDLGCGPGLYAQRLALRGFAVTGMDVAPWSLAHASREAAAAGLEIRWVEADYRRLAERDAYDLALLAYLDLGSVGPEERRDILRRVHAALRPGGAFVFDLPSAAAPREERCEWRAAPAGGFWREGPHLVLERRLVWPETLLLCDEYAVIEAGGETTLYRVWEQRFRPEQVEEELAACGFALESLYGDLTGAPWSRESETLAVVARR